MCCPIITDSGCGCSLELCCKIQGYHSAVWSAIKARVLFLVLSGRLAEAGPHRYAWAAAMPTAFLAAGVAVNVVTIPASVAFLLGVYQKRARLLSPYLVVLLAQLCMHFVAVLLCRDDSIHFFYIGLFETGLFFYMLRGATSYRAGLRDAKSESKQSSHASTDETVVAADGQQLIQLRHLPAETENPV